MKITWQTNKVLFVPQKSACLMMCSVDLCAPRFLLVGEGQSTVSSTQVS